MAWMELGDTVGLGGLRQISQFNLCILNLGPFISKVRTGQCHRGWKGRHPSWRASVWTSSWGSAHASAGWEQGECSSQSFPRAQALVPAPWHLGARLPRGGVLSHTFVSFAVLRDFCAH